MVVGFGPEILSTMLKLMVMLVNKEVHGRLMIMNGLTLFLKSTLMNSRIDILH